MRKICTCGREFEAKRPAAKYCGDRCRKRAQRRPERAATIVSLPAPAPQSSAPQSGGGALEAAARAELETAGRLETVAGGVVMALAKRIDVAGAEETGSAFAALTKELRAALAAAVAGAEQAIDPIDELRQQRERKRPR